MAKTVTITPENLSWDAIEAVEWEGDRFEGKRALVLRYDGATYKTPDSSEDAQYIVTKLMVHGFDRRDVHLEHINNVSQGVARSTIKMRHNDAMSDWRWTLTLVKQE